MIKFLNFEDSLVISEQEPIYWVTLYSYDFKPRMYQEFPTTDIAIGYVLKDPSEMYFSEDYIEDSTYNKFFRKARSFYKNDLKLFKVLRKGRSVSWNL